MEDLILEEEEKEITYPEEMEAQEELQEEVKEEPKEEKKPELNSYEEVIKKYLDSLDDESFKEKYKGTIEEIKDCFNYIKGEAKKVAVNSCAMIEDTQVYQWARHYFTDVREEELKKKAEDEIKKQEREAKKKAKNGAKAKSAPTIGESDAEEDQEEMQEEKEEDNLAGGLLDFI